jgi:hypothetical protein
MKKIFLLVIIVMTYLANVSYGIRGETIEYPHLEGKVKFGFWRSALKYSKIDLKGHGNGMETFVSDSDVWYIVLTDVKGLNEKEIEQINFYITRTEPIAISPDKVEKGDLLLKIHGKKTLPFKIGGLFTGDTLTFEYDFYGASTVMKKFSIK